MGLSVDGGMTAQAADGAASYLVQGVLAAGLRGGAREGKARVGLDVIGMTCKRRGQVI